MNRLTKTYHNKTFGVADDLPCGENSYDFKNLLIQKLGEYEDLEEQGLLIKLPCKIGTPVYFSTQDCNICKDVCDYLDWSEKSDKNYCRNSYIKSLPFEIGFIKYIGKSMFLSKEEVKKSLK